jgi:predicted XRE-type DNA-binding protein
MNWSYVAGLFDGEGTVYGPHGSHYRISVYNTNLEAISELARFAGGRITTRLPERLSKKPIHILTIQRRAEVIRFCRHTLPFLIIKKKRVRECVEFLETRKSPSPLRLELLPRIREMYETQRLSKREIADRLGVNYGRLSFLIRKSGMKLRGRSEATKLALQKYPRASPRVITRAQASELIKRYFTGDISQRQLSDDYGISETSVRDIVNGRREWLNTVNSKFGTEQEQEVSER